MLHRSTSHGEGDRVLRRFDRMASRSAQQVIGTYSTSFGIATALLSAQTKRDIRNLYAIVRIADEIVDGTARQAGASDTEIADLLDAYEQSVVEAPSKRFHVDPVLHAYADTARRCAINTEHVRAFFHSMRMDLSESEYDAESLGEYIYGSAEVIGLMCLSIFLEGREVDPRDMERMTKGARALGAAFQKINFLRDYAEDSQYLGRVYFPEVLNDGLTEDSKRHIVDDIRTDLACARDSMMLLPFRARAGVMAATGLFEELTNEVEAQPVAAIRSGRIRVSDPRKVLIALRACIETISARRTQ